MNYPLSSNENVSQSPQPLVNVAKRSPLLLASFALTTVFRYIFFLAVVRILDQNLYGVLAVAEAILMILGFVVSASFPWAVTRFTTIGKANVLRPGLLANLLMAILACVVLLLAYQIGILRLDYDNSYKTIVIMIMLTILFLSWSNVFQGYLLGIFRFGWVALLRTGGALAQLAVGLTLVVFGFGVPGALAGYLGAAFVSCLIGLWISREALKEKGEWIDKQFTYLALTLMIGILGIHLMINIDQLAVKMFSPISSSDTLSANYKAARLMSTLPLYVITSLIGALFPIAAEYSSEPKRLGIYVGKMLKYVFAFILPAYIILMMASTEILGLIFPSAYTDASKALFALAPGMFLLILVAIVTAVLQGSGHPNKPALLIGGSIIVQIVLLYNLVPRYEIVGASISTSISSALALLGLMVYYPNNFQLRLHWTNSLRILCASILTIMALHMLPMTTSISLLGSIFIGYTIFVIVLVLSRYFDSMDKGFFSFILKTSSEILGINGKYRPPQLDELNREKGKNKR